MKVKLCYQHTSVDIKWDLPVLPRTGEYISITELLSEKEFKQLGIKKIISKSSTSHGFCIKMADSLQWKFY